MSDFKPVRFDGMNFNDACNKITELLNDALEKVHNWEQKFKKLEEENNKEIIERYYSK